MLKTSDLGTIDMMCVAAVFAVIYQYHFEFAVVTL